MPLRPASLGPWQGSLSRRHPLGLLPLLAGFHSGSANERPAGDWRAGGESGPGLLPVPVLPARAACPPRAWVSPGPASRITRAEWWPCPLWAPHHSPFDPVSSSRIRGSAFGPCGAFSPLADAAVLQTLTHPGLITTQGRSVVSVSCPFTPAEALGARVGRVGVT